MQDILLNDQTPCIKVNAQKQAEVIWHFALKIAEKLYIFGDEAIDYAEKILFYELNHSFQETLNFIKLDFEKSNVPFDETEIMEILKNVKESKKGFNKSKDCFYI